MVLPGAAALLKVPSLPAIVPIESMMKLAFSPRFRESRASVCEYIVRVGLCFSLLTGQQGDMVTEGISDFGSARLPQLDP